MWYEKSIDFHVKLERNQRENGKKMRRISIGLVMDINFFYYAGAILFRLGTCQMG